MLRGIPSAAGAPRTPGFGKPPDSAPAELLVGKPLWPGCQRGMFGKVTRPFGRMQCIGLPHYSTLAR
ncbi:hypothetical protein EJF87_08800 [Neisseria meningitidis]|nr:hypothetical protein [Neisseria meningitidis]